MYTFVNNFDQENKPTKFISLYQVATFPHDKITNTEKYHIRKFVINEDNEFVNIKNYYLSKKEYNKFLKIKKPNEYKLFSVLDLSMINYPSLSDILLLKSNILTVDHNYSGYAPF